MTNNNLHDTTDASKWAAEFCKRWPSALCQIKGKEGVEGGDDFEATMIGWFANAIQTGADHAQAEKEAAVVAERRACANMAYEYLTHSSNPMREELAEMIYERTVDTDAQAALEAVKREARNEGLAKAWFIADQNGDVETATALQRLITEEQSDE